MKPCRICNEVLPPENFYTGFKYCKACHKKKSVAFSQANPERRKRIHLKSYLWRFYKMDVQEFDQMLELQKGCCAICDQVMAPPHVDHDHATGKVRGLICFKCNTMLGMAGDNQQTLMRAVAYLEQNNQNKKETQCPR